MKRAFLTILFFMSLLPCIVYAEELFLYISDGQWGYATDDGTVVIAASFSEATPFYNGVMARVAISITVGLVPSPVKAAMPFSAQARTSTSL